MDEVVFVDLPDEVADLIAEDLREMFDVSDADAAVLHVAARLLQAGWVQPSGNIASADEQWFVWAGGPDPDNAAMRCLRDDEADAREYWQWVHTESGSGIARRSVYFGPWEIVASQSGGDGGSDE